VRYERIDFTRTDYAGTDSDRRHPAERRNDVGVLIPGLGVTYAARADVTIFGGVHRGFAPPGPGANADTRAEASVNYEIGSRIRRGAVSAELVGFFNDYDNLLGRDTLAGGGAGEGDLFNGGAARVHGLEASAAWNVAEPLGWITEVPVRLAYTYTSAEFRTSFASEFEPWGTVSRGDDLPYVPRHQLFVAIETVRPQWRAGLEGTYASRVRAVAGQGPYLDASSTEAGLVLSASGEYRLAGGAILFASVQNVANDLHVVGRHPAGARPNLPRLVLAGLKVEVGR
jgi:Fe(3+) dicitrate transport protein